MAGDSQINHNTKTSKRVKLTPKQVKIVKGKAEGKPQRDIGLEVYPNATPESASVLVSRELKKVNVQQALDAALKKHGITLDHAIAPIGKALNATKILISGQGDQAFAEVVEDIDLQLKGSDRALKLMGVSNQESGTVNVNFINVAKTDKDTFDL